MLQSTDLLLGLDEGLILELGLKLRLNRNGNALLERLLEQLHPADLPFRFGSDLIASLTGRICGPILCKQHGQAGPNLATRLCTGNDPSTK